MPQKILPPQRSQALLNTGAPLAVALRSSAAPHATAPGAYRSCSLPSPELLRHYLVTALSYAV
ncbi:hypothetical protein KCP73_23670 [Salmonella enterica subsp. enterica]|nr:hypothetical protein KCP73_23670 [Salmonella enterica subsp. enterica]